MTVTVKRERLTYERFGDSSYFRDLTVGADKSDARARIERHKREMRVELPKRAASIAAQERRMRDEGINFERRVNPNRTPGQGGNFDPPLWIIEEFATKHRPERVLADLARKFPLPVGASSVNVPVLTTGSSAQATTDLEAVPDQDITDTSTSSPVVTISGDVDAGLQLLEQSPRDASFDEMLFQDLTSSYDADLEQMLTTGTGTSGQFTGITQLSGIVSVTYTSASPAGGAFYTALAQTGAQVSDARSCRPEVYIMRFARWAWLSAQEDDQHRPFVPPTDRFVTVGSNPNGPTPVGSIIGVPVVTSESIPATLGTSGNQDLAIAAKPSDYLLFESDPTLAVYTEVLSGTLQVRIQLRNYVAAVLGRYVSGTGVVSGSGMAVASGY